MVSTSGGERGSRPGQRPARWYSPGSREAREAPWGSERPVVGLTSLGTGTKAGALQECPERVDQLGQKRLRHPDTWDSIRCRPLRLTLGCAKQPVPDAEHETEVPVEVFR